MSSNNEIHELFKVAEVELIYRKNKNAIQPIVSSAPAAYRLLRSCWNRNRIDLVEEFKILLLDRKKACIGVSDISSGGTSSTVVDNKIIFATALKANASSIVLVHNHPSGNLEPSESDLIATRRLVEVSKTLGIPLLDHMIVAEGGFLSIRERHPAYFR